MPLFDVFYIDNCSATKVVNRIEAVRLQNVYMVPEKKNKRIERIIIAVILLLISDIYSLRKIHSC